MKKVKHAFGMIRGLRGKNIFLFLDFDGTISPIAPKPEDAYLPEKTRAILRKIAALKSVRTAIISGRTMKEVEKMTGVDGLIYAGSHGMEIKGEGMNFTVPVSKAAAKALAKAGADITAKLAKIPGIIVEKKLMAVSFHYRLAGISKKTAVEKAVKSAAGAYLRKGLLKIKKGKMVFELTIDDDWDKGKAVLWMLSRAKGSQPADDAVAVYLGDDRTDFDAFKALHGRGMTVYVGPRRTVPKYADYYLRSPLETAVFLQALITLKQKENK